MRVSLAAAHPWRTPVSDDYVTIDDILPRVEQLAVRGIEPPQMEIEAADASGAHLHRGEVSVRERREPEPFVCRLAAVDLDPHVQPAQWSLRVKSKARPRSRDRPRDRSPRRR